MLRFNGMITFVLAG